MVYIFKAQTISNSLLCMIFLMSYINLANTAEKIELMKDLEEFEYKDNKDFSVNVKYQQLKEYLKIELESTKEIVLSYYGADSKLKDRKQLSQSIAGKAFIYLKKDQFKSNFFINVLSEDSSYDYKLRFIQKDKMELNLGEQYSYYVTEQNKAMEFFISGTPQILNILHNDTDDSTYKLSIWARGSKNINATLKNSKDQKDIEKEMKELNGFNAYLIQLKELEEFSYTFTIEGNPGDLIKVGSLFFGKDGLCQTIIKDYKMEIFGFLKEQIMVKIFFLTINDGLKSAFLSVDSYDHTISQKLIYPSDYNDTYNIYSFSLHEEKNETFYLYQFSKNDVKTFKIYSPLILGGSYILSLKRGEKVGLLPLLSENNNYLTYQITPQEGNHNSTLVKYTDYPLCKKPENKETSLLKYYSSSLTYKNTEYNKKYSPIDHNQKLLVLTCESKECKIFASIYTEKNNVIIFPSMNYYKYISKGSKDNFMIDLTTDINVVKTNLQWFINIEVLNGKASDLKTNFLDNKNIIQKSNKILYVQYLTNLTDIPLTIEAINKNIVYSIMIKTGEYVYNSQINYLIKYDKNTNEKLITFDIDYNHLLYFVGFYLFAENEFIVEKKADDTMLEGNNFYQDIKVNNFSSMQIMSFYNITKIINTQENSFIELSLFKFNNDNLNDSIILSNNISRQFMFTEKYTQFKFMYLHADSKKDININLQLIDNKAYKMDTFVNDVKKKSYDIKKNQTISLSLKDSPKDEYQPIKIEFVLTSVDKSNSTIEIKIVEVERKANESKNGNDDDNKLFIIIGCSIIGVIVLLIIVVIIILCKSKKSYDDLREKVNSVSFKADKNDEEEDLLD